MQICCEVHFFPKDCVLQYMTDCEAEEDKQPRWTLLPWPVLHSPQGNWTSMCVEQSLCVEQSPAVSHLSTFRSSLLHERGPQETITARLVGGGLDSCVLTARVKLPGASERQPGLPLEAMYAVY